MPLTFDGRPLSDTNRVNDLRDDDLLPLVRPSEPLPQDQNAHMTGGRVKQLLGGDVGPAPAPGITLYAGSGAHTDGAMTQKAATEYADRGPNLRPDGFKSVRFLTRTDPRFDQASDHALNELDTLLTCIGTRCFVEFEEKHYVTRFDAAPRPGGPGTGPQCWRDGHMAFPTPLVPARWVGEDSPSAQVKDYTEYPAGFVFTPGTYVGAYVTSSTTEQFFKAIGPAGSRAAPVAGGNSQWELVSADQVPVTTTYQPVVTLSEATLVTLYNDAALGPYAGKLLLVPLSGSRGTLAMRADGNGSLQTEDAYLLSAANPDAQGVPVSVVVGATAVTTSPRSSTGGSTLWTAAGAAYTAGQFIHNSQGQQFRTTQANASHGTEPVMPLSAQLAQFYTFVGTDEARVAALEAGLSSRFRMRGAWAANTLYQQYDSVSYNGATYYRAAAAFTSGSSFDKTNWVGFGAGLYQVIDYFNEYTPVNGEVLSGNIGRSYVLNGVSVSPFDPTTVAANHPFFSRLFAFRAIGTAPSVIGTANCTIDGSATVVLQPGEQVWLKPVATGYTIVLDTRKGADTFSVLPYAASIAVDFNAATVRTLALTGNVAFTAAANIALLKTKELYLTNTTGAAVTLSFPAGWSFFPGPAPTSLAAGIEAVLYLRCVGTTDSSVKARFIVGTSGAPAAAPTVSNFTATAA